MKKAYCAFKGIEPDKIRSAPDSWLEFYRRHNWKERAHEYDKALAELASQEFAREFGETFTEYYRSNLEAHQIVSDIGVKVLRHLQEAVTTAKENLDPKILNTIGIAAKNYGLMSAGLKSHNDSYNLLLGIEKLAEKYNTNLQAIQPTNEDESPMGNSED